MKANVFKKMAVAMAMMAATAGFAAEAPKAILISADGAQKSVDLVMIQKLKVEHGGDAPSMTAEMKGGEKNANLRCVILNEGESSLAESLAVSAEVSVYPNPVSETIRISGAGEEPEVSIVDMTGKTVLKAKGAEVNVSGLAKGTYVVVVDGYAVRIIKN